MSGSSAAEAKALDGEAREATEPADTKTTQQQRQPTTPARSGDSLMALLSGGLGGALVAGAASIWLFYAKWPVERDQMLAETLKITEETAQAKLAQELTKAQTTLSETQDRLAQIEIEVKKIDHKYEDTLRQIQADTARQEGKLVELQRRQAEIKTKALPAREDSAVTSESVEAANAITSTIQSVRPNIDVDESVDRVVNKPAYPYQNPVHTNKVSISSRVTNRGRYPFILSISVEVVDINGSNIPVNPWIEGKITPGGLIQPNQTLNGSTTLIFPEEWVQSHPGVIQIKTIYDCETSSDVVDSLAKQIHVPGVREQLVAKSSFKSTRWSTTNFN